MNVDNIYNVLTGEEDYDEEEDASPKETPPQPTRQGVAGERSPNARALAAARAAAARRTSSRRLIAVHRDRASARVAAA